MNSKDLDSKIEYELEQELLYQALEEDLINKDISKKRSKEKKLQATLKSGIQLKTIVLLLLTLLVNTYAWFIYLSTVEAKIELHVKEWQFELEDGDSQDFILAVDEIYPGMEKAEKDVIARNKVGSMTADLSCEITKLKILDEEYVVGENDEKGNPYTSDSLFNKMLNDYPFKIKILIDGKEYTGSADKKVMNGGEDTTIKMQVTWDYEKGDVDSDGMAEGDEEDTKWGKRAYDYLVSSNFHPEKYSVQVELVFKAVQHEGGPTT